MKRWSIAAAALASALGAAAAPASASVAQCTADGTIYGSPSWGGSPSSGVHEYWSYDLDATGTCRTPDGERAVSLTGTGGQLAGCDPAGAGDVWPVAASAGTVDLGFSLIAAFTDPATGTATSEAQRWDGAPVSHETADHAFSSTVTTSPATAFAITRSGDTAPRGAGSIVLGASGCQLQGGEAGAPITLAWAQTL
jgi:hypothetical protein